MKTKKILTACALFLASFISSGCSVGSLFSDEQTTIVNHDPGSLWNLQTGREYVAAGRYELAKEHFLLALASADNDATRDLITHELRAVDLMIKTQR